MKSIVVIILAIIFCQGSVTAQIGSTIPSDRKTDWQNVGYNGSPLDNLPAGNSTEPVPAPTNPVNPTTNRINIENAIATASASSHSGNRVVVQLQSGEYLIDKPIELDETNDYIIIRGQGAGSTTIKLAASTATNIVFRLRGQESSTTYNVTNYNSGNNKISLNTYMHGIQPGDYIDIQVADGSWANSTSTSIENDLLGQVVKVKSVYYSAIELEDDFSFVWDLADSENKTDSIYVNEMTTVKEIGIEDLSIETLSSLMHGHLIQIEYGSNIWIKDIETINAFNQHIRIVQSTNVEVRRNYIHHAQGYGSGGRGYGVAMLQRTTNSLVEDNIFQSLRHSMIISRGASRNVFGYNYSREATGEGNAEPADISFHGNFPFLNLFEGNRTDKVHADPEHGSNGHYNTLFRNYIYGQEIFIDNSDNFNVVGNEGKTTIANSSGTLNEYDEIKSHDAWNPADYLTGKLTDLSYYHTTKPSFLQNYNWPPIGPSVSLSASINSHDIPARDRFCTLNPTLCDESKIEKFSDIGVFRENQDPNEPVNIQNKNNRIFGFSSNGTSLSSETDFSFGGYDFHGITSGDYNGDGIEDIAFYRAYGDGTPALNRVFVYTSNGSSFTYLTSLFFGGYDFQGLASGDYNGDGIDDIAFYRAYGDGAGGAVLNRIFTYKSNGSSFSPLTNFSFSDKDFKGITSGDYNGDGIDDIAFYRANSSTNSTLNRIYVYKSNGSSFSSMTNFSFESYDFEGITSGDYNGDRIDDIAIFRENGDLSEPVHIRNKKNRIFAFKSNGTSFSSMTNFSFGGYDFQGITSGDFDGDKVDDIAFYRAISDLSPSLSRVMLYTSNTSTFSYLNHLDFETVDFEGITAGRYFNAVQSKELPSNIIEDEILTVEDFELSAYPNPFNPSTNISVRLVENSSLRLDVYNILGQKVRTLFDGRIDAGTHKFVFDADRLNSGIYFVRAQYNQKVETTKIMLIK